MKKMFKFIFVCFTLLLLVGCSEEPEESDIFTVTFNYESVEDVRSNADTEIVLPFVESDTGFFLGWEDEEGVLYQESYTVEENVTLTPVFELFDDVLELIYDEEEETVIIDDYSGEAPYVKIPYTINGYDVNVIDYFAFSEAPAVRVDIPMTVLELGQGAFSFMPNLEELHFYGEYRGSVEQVITHSEFNDIIAEYDVCSIDGLDDTPTEDNPWVFEEGCPVIEITGATEPVPGPGEEPSLSYDAVLRLDYISPRNIFKDFIFYESRKLEVVTLPDNLNIGGSNIRELFKDLENLEAIHTENEANIFYNNEEVVYSENGILYLSKPDSPDFKGLYFYPSGLLTRRTTIPDDVTDIYWGALTSQSVFYIYLHENISLYDGALSSLPSLEAIYVDPNHETLASDAGVLYSKDLTELVYYPAGLARTTYQTLDGVEIIGNYAFVNQHHLEHLIISSGVKEIKRHITGGAESLRSIDIAATVDNVDQDAFWCMECPEKIIIRNTDSKLDYFWTIANYVREDYDKPFAIYVPDQLLDAYLADEEWQEDAEFIKPLSELVE